ncbi:LapA family protein [Alteromonas ponticola]|uniref:LapA family protein n=1 Tax=Alteromonas aquimaris TaxID=2998417 RepID=A0ABT3P5Q2_9ALTE|nr:LapA family protein [Alteromonas aquimaris]MCW8108101.1 LapA family protein [Alteromonas aquimaris]
MGSQNETLITVNYLIAQSDMRVSTLIAVSVALGVVIGLLMMLVSWLALRVQLMAARAKIRKLTKEA